MTTLTAVLCLAGVSLALGLADPAQDPVKPKPTTWPPKSSGQPVKVMIDRDTWLSNAGSEEVGNNGAATRMKIKGYVEYSLFDAGELAKLKGKIISGCLWHYKNASPDAIFKRVTLSTVATPWVEGTGTSYTKVEGAACFKQAELGKLDWAYPGSNFMDAAFGGGRTIWFSAESTAPDKDGWQATAVDPDVVAARVAGLSYGFGAYDDVGNEWSYLGGKFAMIDSPNRFCCSHEQSDAKPYLEVFVEGEDHTPPAKIAQVRSDNTNLPPSSALVTWNTPADSGGGKTLGFVVKMTVDEKPVEVPRYLIPMAGKSGDEVRMFLRDLKAAPGSEAKLSIAAVDSAGNVSEPVTATVKLSDTKPFVIAKGDIEPFPGSNDLPDVGGLKVAVLDLLDKVPANDATKIMPAPKEPGYRGGNHIWSAAKKLVRIQAARNDAVCFQVNLEGKAPQGVNLKLEGLKGVQTKLYGFDYYSTEAGNLPDICVPLKGGVLNIADKNDPEAAGATNGSALVEIYVPHEATAGNQKGKLTITANGKSLDLEVDLTIWDFTLPNKLSFLPEMNAYGTADAKGNIGFYRLAHEHRTCLNRLYYGWNGSANQEMATTLKPDGSWDFAEFDRTYGTLFDGTAFKDLPRKGEPVDVFYLPFNENWPEDVYANFRDSYWAEFAFAPAYLSGNQKAYAAWADHFGKKGWVGTGFEFFLNNKVYYKTAADYKKSSAYWRLDEPMDQQDFWALRWYGILFHQAVDPVKGKAKMWVRSDVSRSSYDRDNFYGVLDMEVVGGMNPQKARMKQDEMVLWGKSYYTVYGSSNSPATANDMPDQWSVSAWTQGSWGVLPWQTIGSHWDKSDGDNGYPILIGGREGGPFASVRLKAFRQGEQDVEYLTLLSKLYNQPRWAMAAGVSDYIDLAGKVKKKSAEDAGTVVFERSGPVSLWKLRYAAAKMVSAKKPAYQPAVETWADPGLNMKHLPDIGYVPVAPELPTSGPQMSK